MPGTLYVVATPIGNLEDVTFRALRVLREVSIIAAEDTRRTAHLLQHYSISTRTTSLHEHNEHTKRFELLARLKEGASVALVSDAGTPALSDPGAHLIAGAHAEGIRVEPVPGPAAAMAVLSAAGFTVREFTFLGFPPARANDRKRWLQRVQHEQRLLILFEAPHRIGATLRDILEVLGDRKVAIGREMTKAHEELVVRPISQHLAELRSPRGEYALVIDAWVPPPEEHTAIPATQDMAEEYRQMTELGASRRDAIKRLASKYALPARDIYRRIEEAKKEGEQPA